ncbi:MAG: glutathione S-transferase family protein [Steroidobacteraceae bacterium]
MRVYDYLDSGNGYKVRLLLWQLQQPFAWTELDIVAGETRTPEFLRKNLNGRIPALELDDGRIIAESNAILFYLADGSDYLSTDRYERALTLQWLFFEQYSHEPFVATPRYILRHLPADHARRAELEWRLPKGHEALAVMEHHLSDQPFFVAGRYSIADIALYAYTHVAGEGNLDLAPYPAVRNWLARVAAQPRHRPITARPE